MTDISRRSFAKLLGGAGAFAAMSQMGRFAAQAAELGSFRATVGIFLYGGNDSWNMIVPTDGRYSAYAATRGPGLALPQASLAPLAGSGFGLHPAMASLKPVWDAGSMSAVLNVGTLYVPVDKPTFINRPELRPVNLMSHSDEQQHWQGLRARDSAVDGFLGRLNDRLDPGVMSPVMSFAGSDLILLGQRRQALVLPPTGSLSRNGAYVGSRLNVLGAREEAMSIFAKPSDSGAIFAQTSGSISTAYSLIDPINAALIKAPGDTDAYFVDPATGAALTSGLARQLMRVARMVASASSLGHGRQAFFASQGGYDTHSSQTDAAVTGGSHAMLLKDLALAMAGFYNAMRSLGLHQNVTAFTMSDFGRAYRGNASRGSDHGWGGNHIVVGGPLRPRTIHGRYPDTTPGGADDSDTSGRFIPTISQEEYIGAIMRWHGVTPTDMPYILPNWKTWSANGRGPVPFFT